MMARLPRFMLPGYPQHVIVRGNNREPIFAAEEDCRFYLEKLKVGIGALRSIEFKGKESRDVLQGIIARLIQLTGNDQHQLRRNRSDPSLIQPQEQQAKRGLPDLIFSS